MMLPGFSTGFGHSTTHEASCFQTAQKLETKGPYYSAGYFDKNHKERILNFYFIS